MIETATPSPGVLVRAIHMGHPLAVRRLLRDNPDLASSRFCQHDSNGVSRTLMHVATDPPGHYPHSAETIAVLAAAGADVSAPCSGPVPETPLHWAASTNDVEALDALLDAGADLEAPGAVFDGGTPLSDAIGFGQWAAARRLVDRGARTTLPQAAALGLRERILDGFDDAGPAGQEELDAALWNACHGGQFVAALYLYGHGARLDWIPPWASLAPLDAARRSHAEDLVNWLLARGAQAAAQLQSLAPAS